MSDELELNDMHKLMLRNAEEINRLRDRIYETLPFRDKSAYQREQWSQACAAFHAYSDDLWFPGGQAAILRIDAGDPEALENGICFLECRPYFFRSGYIFQTILKRVKRAPLSDTQKLRLQKVLDKRDAWRKSLPDRLRTQAEQGDGRALRKLAELYRWGYKYVPDLAANAIEAAKWYRKAAEQGETRAKYYLAYCYARGLGVAQDWAEAYFWLCVAKQADKQGDKLYLYGERLEDETLGKLTLEQKSAIEQRAREWRRV
jgi:hypothetical protein